MRGGIYSLGSMTLRLLPPIALAAALLLGGCGSTSKTVSVANSEHQLAFSLDEYRIVPRNVSVPAGPLRITVTNHGLLTHNLVVALRDRNADGNRVVLTKTRTLQPGASVVLTPTLRPGHYAMSSTLSNQADLGMMGTLTVR
jgi:hypothetical protein